MEEKLLKLNRVSGNDKRGIPLTNISLQINPGEMHVVLGMDYLELDCLLQLLSGNFCVDQGQIAFGEKIISCAEISHHFQYIVSETVLFDDMTVFDNIYLMNSQLPVIFRKKQLESHLQNLMNETGVVLNLNRKCAQMTRLEKRLVLFYRAIINNPDIVLIFDSNEEINIDLKQQVKCLIDYLKKQKKGVFYLTTQSEKALFFADTISLLRDGQMVGPINGIDARRNPKSILRLFREWDMYTEESMPSAVDDSWLETINIMTSQTELKNVLSYIAKSISATLHAAECVIYISSQEFKQTMVTTGQEDMQPLIHLDLLKELHAGEERILSGNLSENQHLFLTGIRYEQIHLICTEKNNDSAIIIQINFNEQRALDKWEKEYIQLSGKEIRHTIDHSRLLGNTDMLREVHHRIKNNLQLIISLLEIQKYSADQLTPDMLETTIRRVKSIALVHDMFAYKSSGAECGMVSLKNLIHDLAQIYERRNIKIQIDLADILVPYDTATSILMIINELLNNSWKYAFNDTENGIIRIFAAEDTQWVHFTVSDNGKGLPADFSFEQAKGLGFQIVRSIVTSDFEGTIRLAKDQKKGTHIHLDIPKVAFLPNL